MRVSPFACGPTRMISGGRVAPAVPPVARRYPTLVDAPVSQYSAISQDRPALKTPVQFGDLETTVTRITSDASLSHMYSTQPAWNADQSLVLLNKDGGAVVLDTDDWSVAYDIISPPGQPVFFDPVDPDVLWAHGGASESRIHRYRLSEDEWTPITIPGGYTSVVIGEYEGSISDDGRYLVLCGHKADSNAYVIVYDALEDEVEGTLTLTGWGYGGSGLDNAHISRSGNYVIVASYKAGSLGHHVYDRATLTLLHTYTGGMSTTQSTGFPGHMDIGYRTNGDECMVRHRDDAALVSVRLSDGNERVELPGSAMSWSLHISAQNRRRPGWAYISAFYDDYSTAKYLYREIFAMRLDGSGDIERWGQAMFPADDAYALQAKAVVSPYGDRILFTSGWGTSDPREYVLEVPEEMPEPPPRGPELVVNGDFSDGTTGWIGDNGGSLAAVSGGVEVTGTGDYPSAYQDLSSLETGKTYEISYFARKGEEASGNPYFQIWISGNGNVNRPEVTSTVGVEDVFTLVAQDSYAAIRLIATDGGPAWFDNVSIREVLE